MSTLVRRRPVETAIAALRDTLDLVSCHYEPWPFDRVLPRIEPGRVVLPPDTIGARSYTRWSPSDGIELPVRTPNGMPIGRFVLVPAEATVGVAIAPAARNAALDIAAAFAHGGVLL